MKAARFADSHATAYRDGEPWERRGNCRGRPEEWDLDIIGDDPMAIRAAVAECGRCPVQAACEAFTLGLPKAKQPQDLVQAGRVWSKNRHLPGRIKRDERDETNVDKLRAGHAQFIRHVSCGLEVSDDLRAAEAAYQRWRKRQARSKAAAS